MSKKWVKLYEFEGNQLLVTRRLDQENDEYQLRMTVQGDDIAPGVGLDEVSVAMGLADNEATIQELFDGVDGVMAFKTYHLLKESILELCAGLSEAS